MNFTDFTFLNRCLVLDDISKTFWILMISFWICGYILKPISKTFWILVISFGKCITIPLDSFGFVGTF